jgi:hypothetical protein
MPLCFSSSWRISPALGRRGLVGNIYAENLHSSKIACNSIVMGYQRHLIRHTVE